MLYATKLRIEFRLRMLSGKHPNAFQRTNYKAYCIIFVVLVLSAVILMGESLLDSTNLQQSVLPMYVLCSLR